MRRKREEVRTKGKLFSARIRSAQPTEPTPKMSRR
jgi:hypothetical protein